MGELHSTERERKEALLCRVRSSSKVRKVFFTDTRILPSIAKRRALGKRQGGGGRRGLSLRDRRGLKLPACRLPSARRLVMDGRMRVSVKNTFITFDDDECQDWVPPS